VVLPNQERSETIKQLQLIFWLSMNFEKILENEGWEPIPRSNWIAIKDRRAKFRGVFNTDRLGKIVGTSFYVTPAQLSEVTQRLTRQIGCQPQSITSTDTQREATYWGFDTKGVSEENLNAFAVRLAAAVNDLL
jgi:hypothetical protein